MSRSPHAQHADVPDIIVVGGGTAGCCLADRLSEDGRTRVLVLEAGPADTNPWIHIPLGFGRLFRHERLNWRYESQPQAHLGDRRIYLPAGKVLGGSSSINGMVWVRGQPEDYDNWARVAGDENWSWSRMQPEFHSVDGYGSDTLSPQAKPGRIGLSKPLPTHPLSEAFIAAAKENGYRRLPNLSQSDSETFSEYETTTLSGRRVSAATAYLKAARSRPNVRVMTGVTVLKVVFDGENTAIGVKALVEGSEVVLRARQGVVLAAGTFKSPQILLHSGIGDPGQLRQFGIGVRVDRAAVGKNLQDHYGVRIISNVVPAMSINSVMKNPVKLAYAALQYAMFRKGLLSVGGAYAGAFYRSSPAAQRPDIQIHFLPLSSDRRGQTLDSFPGMTANVCQMRPFSVGEAKLASSDPQAPLAIDPKYLSDPRDIEILRDGFMIARKVMSSPPLSSRYGASEQAPGTSVAGNEAIDQYLRSNGGTVFHAVGTCRMGADDDAVVDSRLQVRGARRLWVADASIIPSITSGNTYCPTLIVAERGSRLIASSIHG